MKETERVIGGLEAQQLATNTRLDRIEGKLDTLLSDYWMRLGAGLVISGIVSLIVTASVEYARAKG